MHRFDLVAKGGVVIVYAHGGVDGRRIVVEQCDVDVHRRLLIAGGLAARIAGALGRRGDGDRIGVVDEKGDIIWGDRLMIIFSREILKDNPGASVIFEVKCSQALPEMIEKFGGKPYVANGALQSQKENERNKNRSKTRRIR